MVRIAAVFLWIQQLSFSLLFWYCGDHSKFVLAKTLGSIFGRKALSRSMKGSPITTSTYDVYLVITPFENSIGQAATEELVLQLTASAKQEELSDSNVETAIDVVCVVQCPPVPNLNKTSQPPLQPKFLKDVLSKTLPSSVVVMASDKAFDPYGSVSSIRDSCQECLEGIRNKLFETMVEQQNTVSADYTISATIRIRGFLFNPYGCPSEPSKKSRENSSNEMRLSSLAKYKLVSVAIFAQMALTERNSIVYLGSQGFSSNGWLHPKKYSIVENDPSVSSRIILVGTEAARGLPKMGIPVPNLKEATESSIRDMLFRNAAQESPSSMQNDSWESQYAEMNALAVLYLKALARKQQQSSPPTYYGVVSPGMTPESFCIDHVPKFARTIRFRFKLWMCSWPWVFEKLRNSEIAKTTQEAGALLATAMLNGPAKSEINGKNERSTSGNKNLQEYWDNTYPSGSFVGAKSGTGGPLCEQSLLLYDAASSKVALATNDSTDAGIGKMLPSVNFLGDTQLQDSVYGIVQEIISGSLPKI